MKDELVAGQHAQSGRRALIADEGDSVWLYLSEPDADAITADCWLYNRVSTPPLDVLKEQFASYRARRLPPPAPADLVSPEAVRPPKAGRPDLSLSWSRDGAGVAAWEAGQLMGFIAPGHRRGFSRFLTREGPWGAPLDLVLYAELFRSERT